MAILKNEREKKLQSTIPRFSSTSVIIIPTTTSFKKPKNDSTLTSGGTVTTQITFSSSVTIFTSPTYTWEYKSSNGSWTTIVGATLSSYILTSSTYITQLGTGTYVSYRCNASQISYSNATSPIQDITYIVEADDPILVQQTNPTTIVGATSAGVATNFTLTSNTISVKRGTTNLAYGTSNNQFTVSYTSQTALLGTGSITIPVGVGSGNNFNIGSFTGMSDTLNSSSITYTISIKDLSGNITTQSIVQIVNKSKDGANGTIGVDGKSTYVAPVYQRSATALAAPTGGTFDFSANVLTPPAGWSVSPIAGANPIYVSTTTFSVIGQTSTATAGTWSTPIIYVQDGSNGTSGLSTFLYPIFMRSATALTAPTGGSYNFTTNIGTPPASWSNTVPTGTDPIYTSSAMASISGPTGITSALTWSTPTVLAQNGANGVGTTGTRGSATCYTSGSSWLDATADSAITTFTGSSLKIMGDTVTISNGSSFVATKYWSGSAWVLPGTVIDGNLLVSGSVSAGKIDTTGLTIKDGSGNVIFSSGVPLATSRISGLGTLATVNSVTTGQITGLGSLATANSVDYSALTGTKPPSNATYGATFGTNITGTITSGNIATFIGSGAIGSTYISDLAATKITAGTLAAGVVYAGTVAATNITAGTLAAGVVYAGTVAATNITAGTLATGVVYAGTISASNISAGTLGAMYLNTYNAVHTNGAGNPANPSLDSQTYSGALGIYAGVYSGNTYTTAHALRGENKNKATSGLVGAANGYAFYAEQGIHGPFTGGHDILVPNAFTGVLGDIVIDDGVASRLDISNTICFVKVSTGPNQKGAVGIYSKISTPLDPVCPPPSLRASRTYFYQLDGSAELNDLPVPEFATLVTTHRLSIMNSLGEGQMNICGEGGNLAIGDLIVTSSLPGKGMKQADDLVHSYTVAKSREVVTFSSPTEVKMVACIYMCG